MKNTAALFHRNRASRRDAQAKVRQLPGITAMDVMKLVLILALAASLAGCGRLGIGKGSRETAQTFDGQTYRGSDDLV